MENTESYGSLPTDSLNEPADKTLTPPAKHVSHVEFDDSTATADYANFCRLSGLPEELLIDFGLNPQPTGTSTQPVRLTQRVVTGWYTAKRLLHVLQRTVEHHEAMFGILETDVHKRIRSTS